MLWATGVTLLGYFLGSIGFVKNNIEVILVLIVLVSVVPVAVELLRHRRRRDLRDEKPHERAAVLDREVRD